MTQPASTALPQRVGVVNVGLPLFADAVAGQGAPVISVDWRVPAGGQPALVAALGRLYGLHCERVEAANAEVLRRLDSGVPMLTGLTTVAGAAPDEVTRMARDVAAKAAALAGQARGWREGCLAAEEALAATARRAAFAASDAEFYDIAGAVPGTPGRRRSGGTYDAAS